MNGDPATGIEDIVRRNVAALRSKANLTQQALADQMLLRGIAWTRETVAQVETTNRRLGFTEAIVVAACLDVPVARLTATGAASVVVGESEWTAAYLGAAIAGTTGDTFPPRATPHRRPGACRPRRCTAGGALGCTASGPFGGAAQSASGRSGTASAAPPSEISSNRPGRGPTEELPERRSRRPEGRRSRGRGSSAGGARPTARPRHRRRRRSASSVACDCG